MWQFRNTELVSKGEVNGYLPSAVRVAFRNSRASVAIKLLQACEQHHLFEGFWL